MRRALPHGQGLGRLAQGRPHLAQVLAGLPVPAPHWWPDKANQDVTLGGPSGVQSLMGPGDPSASGALLYMAQDWAPQTGLAPSFGR